MKLLFTLWKCKIKYSTKCCLPKVKNMNHPIIEMSFSC